MCHDLTSGQSKHSISLVSGERKVQEKFKQFHKAVNVLFSMKATKNQNHIHGVTTGDGSEPLTPLRVSMNFGEFKILELNVKLICSHHKMEFYFAYVIAPSCTETSCS